MIKLLLGVGGGIAAFKAPMIVRRAIEAGFHVRCSLTRSGASFVTPLTLEVLSGNAVYQQEYLSATGSGEEAHIVAANWADIVCVAPATAHLIARLAHGLADDFLTTMALAFDGPTMLAPAMHARMWEKDTVRQHVAELRQRGVQMIGPVDGKLASGENGIGRMAEPSDIVSSLVKVFHDSRLAGKRTLITAGPTHEPLDPVRYLANRSSGKMGFALASEAARRGANVVLISGPVSLDTPAGVERHDVETALEMRDLTYRHAAESDLVIMTAAVADYRPRRVKEKLKRQQGIPEIELIENPDILAGLAERAPRATIVGFAAETEYSEVEARRKLESKSADLLVWNDVSSEGIGFGSEENEVTVYRRGNGTRPIRIPRRSKYLVAVDLLDIVGDMLAQRDARTATTNS